jgi:hypothetical protein
MRELQELPSVKIFLSKYKISYPIHTLYIYANEVKKIK